MQVYILEGNCGIGIHGVFSTLEAAKAAGEKEATFSGDAIVRWIHCGSVTYVAETNCNPAYMQFTIYVCEMDRLVDVC